MRVDELTVRGGIDHGAFVMLAMYFHQLLPDGAQPLRADRLIIDEGAGATVDGLNAPQHQIPLGIETKFARGAARRMVGREFEDGGHLPLRLACAHQRGVAAPAERQHEGVEENRFSRAGLAGKRRQPALELKVKSVDQHNVANGEADEHGAQYRPEREPVLRDFAAPMQRGVDERGAQPATPVIRRL